MYIYVHISISIYTYKYMLDLGICNTASGFCNVLMAMRPWWPAN